MSNANAPTARLLDDSGIAPGMRVLDVGSAFGVLTRELAVRVGPEGEVVGIDVDPARIEAARGEAAPEGAGRIEYALADLASELPELGTFDAIVGRRVLMYISDPAAAIARLARLLTPGGIMAWHEHDRAGGPYSVRELPVHRELSRIIWDTVEREGGRAGTAMRLSHMLRELGLEIASMRSEAILVDGDGSATGQMTRMMMPRAREEGVIGANFDEDALIAALAEEGRGLDAPIVFDHAYLVIARKPG